jgi:hypothetical protein
VKAVLDVPVVADLVLAHVHLAVKVAPVPHAMVVPDALVHVLHVRLVQDVRDLVVV